MPEKNIDYEKLAYDIVEQIISSKLVTPECATNPEHGILSVWSVNCYEQIAQLIKERVESNQVKK